MPIKRKTTEQFIIDAYCEHGDKYNYKLVDYKSNKTKIKIICPIHGVFEQTPYNHINRKHGCKKCANNKHSLFLTKNRDIFIQQAKQIHGDKYDYSLVQYKHSHDKIKIICPEHGIFEQIPNSHLQGHGCKECFLNRMTKNRDIFIQQAKQIHGDKYDYSLVNYIKKKTKVKIICSVHGIFEQRPDNHIYGQGCPKCNYIKYSSKQEIEIQEWLKDYIYIITNDRELINPFELDIIIPDKKLAIEFNGLYWHSEQQGKNSKYHLNKYLKCKDKGYRLITIWENEWLFKKDIVKSILLNAIGINKRVMHGRKCKVKLVKPKEARIMYNNNHIQEFKGGMHLGLYFEDELMSLMTIDKRGELQRFVNLKYTKVHGAFSKLLKTFIKYYDFDKIYTFADTRYFTGNVYTGNGFVYQYTTKPNYYYFNKLQIYHRMHFQKKNIERMYNKGELKYWNPDQTEYVNMLKNGYNRIWDNGNMKFIFIVN